MPQTAVHNLAAFPAPDESETQQLTNDIQAQLASVPTKVDSLDTCRRAKESLLILKRAEAKVVEFFRDMKRQADQAHKTICAKEAEQLKPIKAVRDLLSTEVRNFEQQQERERRERERQAQLEEKRRADEAALAEAASVAAADPGLAEQILEQAIAAPAPTVTLPSTRVEVAGVSMAANWTWRFQGCAVGVEFDKLPDADKRRIVDALPKEFLRPDERSITKVVKALRSATRIAGVEAFDAGSVRVRA